jgi:hypothetical protein
LEMVVDSLKKAKDEANREFTSWRLYHACHN